MNDTQLQELRQLMVACTSALLEATAVLVERAAADDGLDLSGGKQVRALIARLPAP